MKTKLLISAAAALLLSSMAPALAAQDSDVTGTNVTGSNGHAQNAPDSPRANAMANKGMAPASRMDGGSTTGSGMGGAGTTESHPSNTK